MCRRRCIFGTALLIACIGAHAVGQEKPVPADNSGAKPGDDALTCEQIYAEGMAETRRDQDERDRKNEQRKAQGAATAALIVGAELTGGMGGTGQAAQKAAEGMVGQTAELGTPPPPNPRMERIKQLWTQKHCVRK